MSLVLAVLILIWAVMAVGCWLGYLLVRQSGRILLRLDALEERLGPRPSPSRTIDPALALPMTANSATGLPLGQPAPAFTLPDLNGEQVSLEQFRGRRILLISWDPGCGFCRQMAPELASLPVDDVAGSPLPILVATGDVEQNRTLVAEHDIRCPVLLQHSTEVTSRYGAHGTPMGYLIDEQGRIASDLAVGAQALLELYDAPARPPEPSNGKNGHAGYKGNRPLETSRLVRNGLPKGTRAPEFRLPLVTGGELSLQDLRGRRLLLVFSDPSCGPCNALAGQLGELHPRQPDLAVVMISRGEVKANRAKIAAHRLTFPVVLQRQWEISREYGIFATPVGYLIDEDGVIAADVATGADAILALVSEAPVLDIVRLAT